VFCEIELLPWWPHPWSKIKESSRSR